MFSAMDFCQKWWFLSLLIVVLAAIFILLFRNISLNDKDLSSKHYEDNITIKQFKIYLLFFGLALPILELLLELYGIRPQRQLLALTVVSISCLALFFYGTKLPILKKYFKQIFVAIYFAIIAYIWYKFYINSDQLLSFAELLLVFVFAPNVFLKLKHYWLYVVLSIAGFLAYYALDVVNLQEFIIVFYVIVMIIIIHYIKHVATLNTQQKYLFANEIVNNGSSLVIAANNRGEIKFCSENIIEILGYSSKQVLGLEFYKLTGDSEFIGEKYYDNYVDLQVYTRHLTCADGSIKIIQWKDKRYSKDLFISIGQDITADYELQNQYRNFVENAQDIIFELDENGLFTYINEFTADLLGYHLDEILKVNHTQFIRKDFIPYIIDCYKNVLKERNQFPILEFPILKKNGDELWISQKVFLKKNFKNEIIGFSGIGRDITAFKNNDFQKELLQEKNKNYALALNQLYTTNFEQFESQNQIINLIIESAAEVLRMDKISFWRFGSDTLECETIYLRKEFFKEEAKTSIDIASYPIYINALKDNPYIQADNVFKQPALQEFFDNYYDDFDIKSALDVPLFLDGKLSGVLSAESIENYKTWDFEDINFFKTVADIIALSLNSKIKFDAEKNLELKNNLLAAINFCTEKLLLGKALPEIFYESFEVLGNAIQCDHIFYHEFDKKNNNIRQKYKWGRKGIALQIREEQDIKPELMKGVITHILEKKYLAQITSQISDDYFRTFLECSNIKSVLLFPLYIENEPLGFIGFDDCTTEKIWSYDEITILKNYANNISFALERRNKDNAIYESEEKFRLLSNNIPGTVYLANYDQKWTKIFLNDEIEKLTGYSKSDFLEQRMHFIDLIHKDDVNNIAAQFKTTIDDKKPFNLRYRIHNKNNDIVWVEEIGDAIYKNDKIIYIVGIFIDVTNSMLIDKAIKDKEIAQASNKAKSEFLANMSHELRTPLNGILGFTDLLIKTNLNNVQKKHMITINQSARSLMEIVNDILDFSKIEASKLKLNIEEHNLIDMLNQIIELISFEANRKNLDLKLIIENDVPTYVLVDVLRLKQVLINLLSNAVKFTNEGSIILKVSIRKQIKENENILRFAVKDTGIGIKAENLSKIFKAFSQEDNSATRQFGGTGLGLTISNQLLKLMKSKLKLKSIENQGSTFYFNVQMKCSSETKETTVTIEDEIDQIEELSIELVSKIMIVEDNRINALLLKTVISKHFPSIQIIEACDGLEAVALYKSASPELIFMDIQMPNMNGYEATKEIRNLTNGKNTIIIAVSAGILSDENALCLSAGMNDYFSKPISKETICNIIRITKKQISLEK